jgi:nitrate/nitrite transport system substrate-binding protein
MLPPTTHLRRSRVGGASQRRARPTLWDAYSMHAAQGTWMLRRVLSKLATVWAVLLIGWAPAMAAPPEKDELVLGFIKLTDCAPLVIAKELGFFEDEDLFVRLEAQANWKILLDRVISGELDGAHMLAGQPIAATIGIGTQADLVTAFSMDLNGNAITVSNDIWARMKKQSPALQVPKPAHPISASNLRPIVEEYKASGTPLRLGMVFPVSTHNYELRYWLAAGGIKPGYYTNGDATGTQDADVLISVTPPPQMPATLEQGTIQGYCVGEPWNQAALAKGIGVPVITDEEIWKKNPEKVFGVTNAWAEENPETHLRVVKALIRAGQWLDASPANREKAVDILSQSEYVGADRQVIANSMTGSFEFEKGDRREAPDFNVFFRYFATYPFFSDGVWYLTQMRRWGQIADAKPDGWYDSTIRKVYRPDIWREAAARLVADGVITAADVPETDGYKPPDDGFIDGIVYDGRKPGEYLRSLAIGLKDGVLGAEAR